MDKCYYGSLKDVNEVRKSSSGGFAASIAKHVIQRSGIVYGVAYTSDFKGAEYIRATSEQDLQKLLGSKYIYADNTQIRWGGGGGGLFDDIKSGSPVVLIGLPCNIATVMSTLQSKGIEHRNLITIDMVCGGATPAAVGKEYIEYLERKNKSKVVELSVRYKNPNWTPPFLRAVFENGKSYCKEFYETEYGYAFDRMKREACYTCRFKGDNHLSDITIGDGWGISKDDPGYNPAGVSVAFVHSEAGDSLLKELDDIVLFEGDPEELKRSNPRYLTPKPKLQKDEPFRINFQKYGLLKACKKAYSLKKRILNATPEALLKSLRQIKRLVKK